MLQRPVRLATSMLWFGKRAKSEEGGHDRIVPATLEVDFYEDILTAKMRGLADASSHHGGLEVFVEALRNKHQLCATALDAATLPTLADDQLHTVSETVFAARRRLFPVFQEWGPDRLRGSLEELLHGQGPLLERLNGFSEQIEGTDKSSLKTRRALWDYGAELLHFRVPEQYPLMTRWVWDPKTMSGALREFIKNNDTMRDVPLKLTPEAIEGARVWLAERLNEAGYYRDVPFLVDLALAQAYADYSRAMSMTLGMIDAEFGAKHDPMELQAKLLGIDPHRRATSPSDRTLH